MEPVGLAVGIVGLAGILSTCLDVIERVDYFKDFDHDSRSLAVQFDAEKLRLKQWAYDVGFREGKLLNDHHAALDEPQVRLMTTELLGVIKEICGGSATTFQQRTLQPETRLDVDVATLTHGIESLQSLQKPKESRRLKLSWSIRGKARRASQVENFGVLVQHLHNLVPPNSATSERGPETGSGEAYNHENAETRRELRAWLKCPPPTDLFHESKQKRLERTCDWVLNRHEFIEWLAPNAETMSTERLLWINGPAGLGKTVLCASIVEHLMSTSQAPVAYFFLSSDFESRDDPYAAVRSWVYQLMSCSQVIYHLARDKWLAQHEEFATQMKIVNLFREVVQAVPGAFFILDGLDECTWVGNGQGDGKSLKSFLNTVAQAVADTCSHILVVSRDEPEIRSGIFGSETCRELKIVPDDVQSDVARYSRSIVDKKLSKKDDETREGVSQILADRSHGQFLWVKLHEDSLRSWKNRKQLEDTINDTPPGLDRVYERNWARISQLPEPIRNRAYSLLQWAAFSIRPLTVNEITEAVLIDEDGEEFSTMELPDEIDDNFIECEIQSPCGSLLEIRDTCLDSELGLKTVHLTHFSVKQYFLCHTSAQGLSLSNDSRLSNQVLQNNKLAKLCLRYINSRHFWDYGDKPKPPARGMQRENTMNSVKGSFRNYAADSWYQHAASGDMNDATLFLLTNALFDVHHPSWEVWRDWIETHSPIHHLGTDFWNQPRNAGPLHYATQLGFNELAFHLIHNRSHDVNEPAAFGRTALEIASSAGDFRLSHMLLDAGAKSTCNHAGSTPLLEASYKGATNIVQLLLQKGADPKVTGDYNWTAINVASYYGHLDTVALLLRSGADIFVANKGGLVPLSAASYSGHLEVVELLLENRADVTHANADGWSSIHLASDKGHYKIVQRLLDAGADLSAVTNRGWTPLHIAAHRGHLEIVQLFLEKGADSTALTNDRWTPIHMASTNRHKGVVKLLISGDNGGSDSNEPIPALLREEHVAKNQKIVKALFDEHQDDIRNPFDAMGWTPLHDASYNGRIELVQWLIDEGADGRLVDDSGWTPLHAATVSGHTGVVELLLHNPRCKTGIKDNSGRTPLFYASARGHYAVLQLLADQDPLRVYTKDHYGSTPLSAACRNGHEDIVKYLLPIVGSLFDSPDILGRGSMWWARKSGSARIIRLLSQHASEFDVELSTDSVLGTQAVDFTCESAWCDICMASISAGRAYYLCDTCYGGGFVICFDCQDLDLKCQDISHSWVVSRSI
ncbi:hypothetical protein CSIM01_01953 [Colletotrichum simmondsii]|uniref:NACHT domain-containing protein n=1 Tax=Colletotrichum simmondsii TaxID=703756 RepID=A0A135SGK3_9PEZI|nr:hypothetical protein CSIM01_01953 [Colletotrichum simmondsii]